MPEDRMINRPIKKPFSLRKLESPWPIVSFTPLQALTADLFFTIGSLAETSAKKNKMLVWMNEDHALARFTFLTDSGSSSGVLGVKSHTLTLSNWKALCSPQVGHHCPLLS